MPRMSKKLKHEWSLFLNHRGRRCYNSLCRRCIHSCKACPIKTICAIFPAPHPVPDYRTNRTYRTKRLRRIIRRRCTAANFTK